MSIVQISKIQQRSGNLVDLPQLDEAEFGWASDQKRLFIGKTTPNENVEVLTSYSGISFSQIDGSVGNLNINPVDVGLGQVLAFDGTNWINAGGNAGGNINLGNISNVTIAGGAIGYVLQTDGLGNLSWAPKTTITAYIENASNTSPVVITTTQNNYFTNGATITITGAPNIANSIGNALNGGNYYVKAQTSNTFALYTDPSLSTPYSGTGHNAYSYSSNVTATTVATNVINIGNSVANANVLFEVNQPVVFLGGLSTSGLTANTTYYINSIPSATTITVSNSIYPNGTAGPILPLQTTSGLTATVYGTGGRVISSIGGSGGGNGAQGSNLSVQFNDNNLLAGNANFTYDFANTILTVNGGNVVANNFIASNLVSAKYLTSNIATGTAPLIVTSTTRVANLNVDHANVADYANITTTSSGTSYLMLANATSGNVAEYANANLSFNAATGNLSTTNLNITGNANIGVNLGVAGILAVTANINGGNLVTNNNVSAGTLNATGNANVGNIGATNGVFSNISGNGAQLSALTGANVTGAVAYATTANSVAGANVSGAVAYATIANSVAGANVTGAVAYATTANSVAGANVSGAVAYATTANSVAGANVSGTVATANNALYLGGVAAANYALSNTAIANATFANTANNSSYLGGVAAASYLQVTGTGSSLTAITGANVTGTVANATTVIGAVQNNITTLNGLTTINAGSNTTVLTFTGNLQLSSGSRLQATYADLAEYYEADQDYEPGTVLEFGGDKEVTIAQDGTSRVAGVVSTNPAYVMNSTCPGIAVAIALQGRVPVKVRGLIKKGDLLVSGGNGYARPGFNPGMGTVIGKALENHEGEGVIEVAIGRL